jgi:ParB/RepB/Spo0J family partition protein
MEELIMEGMPMSRPGSKVHIANVSLNKIKLNKNSRLNIDPEELAGLMASIKDGGLLQPIGLVEDTNGKYEVCYGNRRFLAVSKLGLATIPAIIHKKKSESDVDIKNLTENVQRRNISLAEVGRYIGILEAQGLSNKEAAIRLGVNGEYVKQALMAFNNIPKEFQAALATRYEGTNTNVAAGKISLLTAKTIINATKDGLINEQQGRKLFRAAKSSKKFRPEALPRYIEAIAHGEEDFLDKVKPIKRVRVQLFISQDEYDSIWAKFIQHGPFSSIQSYCIAILTGEKAGKIKVLKDKLSRTLDANKK